MATIKTPRFNVLVRSAPRHEAPDLGRIPAGEPVKVISTIFAQRPYEPGHDAFYQIKNVVDGEVILTYARVEALGIKHFAEDRPRYGRRHAR